MRKAFYQILLVICLFTISSFCVASLLQIHKKQSSLTISWISKLPHSIARLTSLEFLGIASDFLILNTLTFLGENILNENTLSNDDWKMVYRSLLQAVNLDPYGEDAFVLAETTLPWESGLIAETNEILELAGKGRPQDPRPYFFIWFNYYYFLNDNESGAKYLQKAAKIPGAPQHYTTLAARMHLMAGHTQEGILFLEEIIKETNDEKRSVFLKKRLRALKIIEFLEKNILRYKHKFGKIPDSLEDLVKQKIIKAVPPDPYGGTFYIMDNGRVNTTSKLVMVKKN